MDGPGEGERQSPMGEGFSSLISFNIGDPGISRLYSRTTRRVLEGELSKGSFPSRWLPDRGEGGWLQSS